MKKILISFAVVASLGLCHVCLLAHESDQITQAQIDEQNSASDASNQDITPKSIEDFFDEFANLHDITYGQTIQTNAGSKTFYTGEATTILKPSDPEFGKSLATAYERAILDLQYNYIRNVFGKIIVEKTQNTQADKSTNAKEFPPLEKGGRFSQLLDKIIELAGAKIDEYLKELGVDVNALSEKQKKVLYANDFIKKTTTKAFGDMSGLVPVQTKITQNKQGSYDIGVIAVISDKTIQVARDMAHKRRSIVKGNGKPVKEFLPKDNKGFMNEYGIRMVYNENGEPVIISYGNWSFVADSSDGAINREHKRTAQETALAIADSAISEFVNISVNLSNQTEVGDSLQQVIEQEVSHSGAQESEKIIKNIIDRSMKDIKTRSKMDVRGIREIKRWSATDENGVDYVGVVRVYSYDNLKNTNDMLAPKNQQKNSSPEPKKSSKSVERTSKQVNNLDDF